MSKKNERKKIRVHHDTAAAAVGDVGVVGGGRLEGADGTAAADAAAADAAAAAVAAVGGGGGWELQDCTAPVTESEVVADECGGAVGAEAAPDAVVPVEVRWEHHGSHSSRCFHRLMKMMVEVHLGLRRPPLETALDRNHN